MVGGQFGQAKFAGSGVRGSPGHATRFDQKSRSLTTVLSLKLLIVIVLAQGTAATHNLTTRSPRRAKFDRAADVSFTLKAKLLKGSVDQGRSSQFKVEK